MNEEKVFTTLKTHVPGTALQYCFALWRSSPFELKITRTRNSKVGDFTSRRDIKHPRITLNHDLNPYLFLTTYIHEVAHLYVHLKHGNRVDPHGDEWKNAFKRLMEPVMTLEIYPPEIFYILQDHMASPKASSFADADLTRAFRIFDANATKFSCLSDIPEGSIFQFQKRYFQKGKIKRTRFVCKEIKSNRNYLIPAEVLVSDVQLALL